MLTSVAAIFTPGKKHFDDRCDDDEHKDFDHDDDGDNIT